MPTWTIKSYMDRAADKVGITRPASWTSASDANTRLMKTLLMDAIDDMLDRVDWADLTGEETITGDGSTTSFSLPAGFKRVTNDEYAVFENSTFRRPCTLVADSGKWRALQTYGTAGNERFYRLNTAAGTIEFYPTPGDGTTIKLAYITDRWVRAADLTTPSYTWTAETDISYIPGNLIELACTYRWKEQKGLAYADAQAKFESALARAASNDKPNQTVNFSGERRAWNPVKPPVPDFIPSS